MGRWPQAGWSTGSRRKSVTLKDLPPSSPRGGPRQRGLIHAIEENITEVPSVDISVVPADEDSNSSESNDFQRSVEFGIQWRNSILLEHGETLDKSTVIGGSRTARHRSSSRSHLDVPSQFGITVSTPTPEEHEISPSAPIEDTDVELEWDGIRTETSAPCSPAAEVESSPPVQAASSTWVRAMAAALCNDGGDLDATLVLDKSGKVSADLLREVVRDMGYEASPDDLRWICKEVQQCLSPQDRAEDLAPTPLSLPRRSRTSIATSSTKVSLSEVYLCGTLRPQPAEPHGVQLAGPITPLDTPCSRCDCRQFHLARQGGHFVRSTTCAMCRHSHAAHGLTEQAALIPQAPPPKLPACLTTPLEFPDYPCSCGGCHCEAFTKGEGYLCRTCLHTCEEHLVDDPHNTLHPEHRYDGADEWSLALGGDVLGLELHPPSDALGLAFADLLYGTGYGITRKGTLQRNVGCLFEPPNPRHAGGKATALHFALASRSADAVKAILLSHANPNIRAELGASSEDIARQAFAGEEQEEVLRMLRIAQNAVGKPWSLRHNWEWEGKDEVLARYPAQLPVQQRSYTRYQPPFHGGDATERIPKFTAWVKKLLLPTTTLSKVVKKLKVKTGTAVDPRHYLYTSVPMGTMVSMVDNLLGKGSFEIMIQGSGEIDSCCNKPLSIRSGVKLAQDTSGCHLLALSPEVNFDGLQNYTDRVLTNAGVAFSKVGIYSKKHPSLCDYKFSTPAKKYRPCLRVVEVEEYWDSLESAYGLNPQLDLFGAPDPAAAGRVTLHPRIICSVFL